MTLTKLDRVPALIVVDLQQGTASLPTVTPMQEVVARAATLAGAFRRCGYPVVLVNVTGGAPGRTEAIGSGDRPAGWTELLDELDPQPADVRISKQRWGAFHGTDLDTRLRELEVTQVFVAGVVTRGGVESTARAASEHGYHVVTVIDAMSDTDAEAHRNSVERVFPRLGETATTNEVLARLDATPHPPTA